MIQHRGRATPKMCYKNVPFSPRTRNSHRCATVWRHFRYCEKRNLTARLTRGMKNARPSINNLSRPSQRPGPICPWTMPLSTNDSSAVQELFCTPKRVPCSGDSRPNTPPSCKPSTSWRITGRSCHTSPRPAGSGWSPCSSKTWTGCFKKCHRPPRCSCIGAPKT